VHLPDVAHNTAKKETAEMPDIVTGMEKEERDSLAAGQEIFGERELTGPFGTPEKPVIVHSIFDRRIVGCEGGKVRALKDYACPFADSVCQGTRA
jgi:hypothetical protein